MTPSSLAALSRHALELATTRSELAVTWLEHLLQLSMLQHHSGQWTWGRYVVVYPAGNGAVRDACARYRELLGRLRTGGSMLADTDFDTGATPRHGEYSLADDTYAELLKRLEKNGFDAVSDGLRRNILAYYRPVDGWRASSRRSRRKAHRRKQSSRRSRSRICHSTAATWFN